MYSIYTAVFHAGYPYTYVQDVRYTGFAGTKTGHAPRCRLTVKILINRGALKFVSLNPTPDIGPIILIFLAKNIFKKWLFVLDKPFLNDEKEDGDDKPWR